MYALTPVGLMKLGIQTSLMMAEAQMVIAMRMMGMMGMWRVAPNENARMVGEKVSASLSGATEASRAMMAGRPVTQIAAAALRPVRRATKSNVTRLARLGPGKPD